MDNGDGGQFIVLSHCMTHKFSVLCFLPHVKQSAIYEAVAVVFVGFDYYHGGWLDKMRIRLIFVQLRIELE